MIVRSVRRPQRNRCARWLALHCRLVLAVLFAASASGCSYIQFLPFLKRPVNTSPRGARATKRGPAFGTSAGTRQRLDSTSDWPAYNRDYAGNRFSPLAQITTANVGSLRPACTFDLGERAVMQSGPVVMAGVMYLTTAINTYAIDAATCRLKWRHTYDYSPHPDYDLKVNRGIAFLATETGPMLFRGSNDGRVYAIDAHTGKERWNVLAGDVRRGETFPAAPLAWNGRVFIGNAGGDNFGVTGRMMAFDAQTGARIWSFDLVPHTGSATFTWPKETNEVPHGGATTWTTYTLDEARGLIYVPTGNAAPDFLESLRPGANMHTYSIVVLSASDGLLVRSFQLLPSDFHDWDVAAAPVLLRTAAGRDMIAAAGKDGLLYGIARDSGTVLYRTELTTIANIEAPLTEQGTRFCPGVQGGVEWNGPAFSPQTNLLYVGAVDWCSTVKVRTVKNFKGKAGIPWTGSAKLFEPFGKMDPLTNRRGRLSAIDADGGQVRWRYDAATPLVAGVTATAGGVVFAADLNGQLLGFDARNGSILFRYETHQPIGGGIVTYRVGDVQYLAVASGLHAPLTWRVKSSPAKVVVFALPR